MRAMFGSPPVSLAKAPLSQLEMNRWLNFGELGMFAGILRMGIRSMLGKMQAGCVLARCINLHIQAYLVDKQVAVVSRLRPAVYGRLDIKVEAHFIGVRAVAHRVILHLPLVFDPIFDKFLAKHITNQ